MTKLSNRAGETAQDRSWGCFWQAYVLIALGSLLFMIRFGAVGSFWYDEFAQISFSGLDRTLAESALIPDPTPPLFNVLANIWYHLVPYGDRWLLLLPQLAMAGAIVLTGVWGESFGGRNTGVWAALFLGFSQIVMEQCGFEFRGYGCFLLFAAAAFCLHEKRNVEGKHRGALFALAMAGLMYSHLFGSLIVLTFGLWDLSAVLKKRAPFRLLVPYFFAGAAFLPWVLYFLIHVAAEAAGTSSIWMVKPTPWEVIKLGTYLCGNHIVLCVLLLLGGILVCREAWTAKKDGALSGLAAERLLPLCAMALSVGLVYLYGALRSGYASLWEKRYFTGLFPCAAVYCGYGASALVKAAEKRFSQKRRAAAALTAACLFLSTVPVFLVKTGTQDTTLGVYYHREAAALLLEQPDIRDDGVLVLSTLDDFTHAWNVYYAGRGEAEAFTAKGIRAVSPEDLKDCDVVYYEHGFWPENAEKEASVRALKEQFEPDTEWEAVQVTRYIRR